MGLCNGFHACGASGWLDILPAGAMGGLGAVGSHVPCNMVNHNSHDGSCAWERAPGTHVGPVYGLWKAHDSDEHGTWKAQGHYRRCPWVICGTCGSLGCCCSTPRMVHVARGPPGGIDAGTRGGHWHGSDRPRRPW